MSDPATFDIYQLKVSLRDISPMIWRRLLVPADLTLFGLHRNIQIVFGWEDYHLHAFKLHGRRYGTMWTGERHRRADGREVALADLGACACAFYTSTTSGPLGTRHPRRSQARARRGEGLPDLHRRRALGRPRTSADLAATTPFSTGYASATSTGC